MSVRRSGAGGSPYRPSVLAAVAVGGVLGAEARFGLGMLFPSPPGAWPWTTFWINVSGCVLIGVLLTLLAVARPPHPLLRPLLGVGVLGGYTTFSAWAVDSVGLAVAGRSGTALLHVLVTPVAAVLACAAGVAATRRLVRRGGRA
ncbi:fluoride efflux transporter FluC [Pseudonocardia sp. HH130630-07]|uniref:fluoride efflux transporter FluC n=1 Tax=Pseudonocardia sp. HH130630-07 TaxID=1690815 RepID=UPI0008153916|nr:CrcB family protein [Pseudonocardia sp. HH130630-07]ANY06324.1 chromosome condensation protein CrcB [Pseudonocardia sp. HH130630-07]